jgi:signal transduction histidine kinase
VPLQQVLFNLIMNAIEAMSAVTERERQLTIQAVLNERTSVRVAVEDTGSGIDPAHIDRIFDPFFTTKSHGMGLGLSICRSIIEAHGGKLWALPRSPFGTSFFLTRPSAETEDRPDF